MDENLQEKSIIELVRELDLISFSVGYSEGIGKNSSALENRRYYLYSEINNRLKRLDNNIQNLKELLNLNV